MAATMPSSRLQTLFLPGLLCDNELWRDQVHALADVVEAQIADLTLDSDVPAMARRALATAPDRFALVALSMGGYVAFEILRQAPERVTSLVLLSTSASADDAARQAQRRAALTAPQGGRFLGVTERLLPKLIHPSLLGGTVAESVKAMASRVGADAFLRQQQAILDRPEFLSVLACITVPTLIGVGDTDQLTPPAESMLMRDGIAGSQLHIFTECGHLPPMEQPEETRALLRHWLTGVRQANSKYQPR